MKKLLVYILVLILFFSIKVVNAQTSQINISGQLKNDTDAVEANVSVYNQGTNVINASQVTSNGLYNITVWPNVYDVQYNIPGFFIPNFYIEISSLNLSSNISNVVNYVNQYPSQNKLSFTVNDSASKIVQTYSDKKPSRVLINGTNTTEVDSLSQLIGYTWLYNISETELYINMTYIPPTCSDGTLYGQCSATEPKYCSNGNLTDKCSVCGCPSNQNCNMTTDSCYIPPNCSDGTLYGQCSSNKPSYCDNGNLTDKCSQCGCSSGQSCNSTSGTCYTPPQTCSDGTAYNSCSNVNKPSWCDNSGNLILNQCNSPHNCACPTSQSCNATTGSCYTPQKCSDGTLYGQCSSNKPKYCSSGTLTDKCSLCSCPSSQTCNATSDQCYTIQTCSDGTLYGQCSANKPKYCSSGTLTDKCSQCGCSAGYNCLANESCNSTTTANYYVIGSGGSYTAKNSSGQTILTDTNAATLINKVLNMMKSGQKVAFSGNFVIDSTITAKANNILLDFSQATITSTISSGNTVVISASYTTINGGDWSGGNEQIVVGSSSNYITIQNTNQHNPAGGGDLINLVGGQHHKIINCKLGNCAQGIFVNDQSSNNEFIGNEFYNWHSTGLGHAIYLDGSSTAIGNNNFTGNIFHNSQDGLVIKCKDNTFSNNTFDNFTVGLSIFSQYAGTTANDNNIFDNTFSNLQYGIWLGNPDTYSPTVGNKIHDNNFTSISNGVLRLNPWSGGAAGSEVDDTLFYYNKVISCGSNPFPLSELSPSLIKNTVIAYNNFSTTVTGLSVETYVNTMIYNNTRMADFNVPTNKTIPPP